MTCFASFKDWKRKGRRGGGSLKLQEARKELGVAKSRVGKKKKRRGGGTH